MMIHAFASAAAALGADEAFVAVSITVAVVAESAVVGTEVVAVVDELETVTVVGVVAFAIAAFHNYYCSIIQFHYLHHRRHYSHEHCFLPYCQLRRGSTAGLRG